MLPQSCAVQIGSLHTSLAMTIKRQGQTMSIVMVWIISLYYMIPKQWFMASLPSLFGSVRAFEYNTL